MSSQRCNQQWAKEEVEQLVGWMEDNISCLDGKQLTWHKEVKEDLFPENDIITVKKINNKVNNMKKHWKDARAMAEHSGWGLQNQDDNEDSINAKLECKCPFYWQLEELWGSRPNATVILDMESSQITATSSQRVTVSNTIPPAYEIEDDDEDTPIFSQDLDRAFSWDPIPPPPNSSERKSLTPTPRSSTRTPTPSLSSMRPNLPKRSEKKDLSNVLKRAFEDKQAGLNELATKRIKASNEVKLERIASQERVAKSQHDGLARQTLFQQDRQVRQMEIFAKIMKDVLAARQGRHVVGTEKNAEEEDEEKDEDKDNDEEADEEADEEEEG